MTSFSRIGHTNSVHVAGIFCLSVVCQCLGKSINQHLGIPVLDVGSWKNPNHSQIPKPFPSIYSIFMILWWGQQTNYPDCHMDVSWQVSYPQSSSIIDAFSTIKHPFWGTPSWKPHETPIFIQPYMNHHKPYVKTIHIHHSLTIYGNPHLKNQASGDRGGPSGPRCSMSPVSPGRARRPRCWKPCGGCKLPGRCGGMLRRKPGDD